MAEALESFLTPSQVEFLSEDELVQILPNFKLSKPLPLISGSYEIVPSIPVDVPLWLALELSKQGKCKIQYPKWLDPDRLNAVYEREKQDSEFFEEIPYHYMEMANQLLHVAASDSDKPDDTHSSVESLWTARTSKIRDQILSLLSGDEPPPAVQLTETLSAMEINRVRPFLLEMLDQMHSFTIDSDSVSQSQSQSSQASNTSTLHTPRQLRRPR
eukprot:TRINITY_DN2147_c0_g1_i1.p1 TRINITY_DN2147_c0_g1~~TRINITY_DN2147_c0_g1_i1.p1  ORF type:complete len:215 (-),score=46.32 TRINITY_DN2147_c0_g1_i1:269-913(-)